MVFSQRTWIKHPLNFRTKSEIISTYLFMDFVFKKLKSYIWYTHIKTINNSFIMDIQAKKLNLIEWLIQIKDESIINTIDSYRKKINTEGAKKVMTIEELYAVLEDSESEYKTGKTTSIEDLKKESENW